MADALYPDLAGKTVLVTGGGSGIGASIVEHFAIQKAKVGFIDIAREPSAALARRVADAGGTVHYEPADVTDSAALRQAIAAIRAAFGPITILINNAAHDERHAFFDVTSEIFDDRVAVNIKHAYFAAQAVIPDMIDAGGGAIVNFGSVSWMIGSENLSVYATMKSAAHGLTRVLAREFGKHNVRVNCVVPGWIMTERQVEKWLTPEGERQIFANQCLKRKLVPQDVARAVVFLASEQAGAITNQDLVVDGGWT